MVSAGSEARQGCPLSRAVYESRVDIYVGNMCLTGSFPQPAIRKPDTVSTIVVHRNPKLTEYATREGIQKAGRPQAWNSKATDLRQAPPPPPPPPPPPQLQINTTAGQGLLQLRLLYHASRHTVCVLQPARKSAFRRLALLSTT